VLHNDIDNIQIARHRVRSDAPLLAAGRVVISRQEENLAMSTAMPRPIAGTTAMVTGANRGLGQAFVRALLARGADKVYAAARRPDGIDVYDPRVVPVGLDITKAVDIDAAVRACPDTSLLINNAGLMRGTTFTTTPDIDGARAEMETNYFGTLLMSRAFAPSLAAHQGALVNVLSIASFFANPFNGTYCASKSAEWVLTNALRIELRSKGIAVVGVHAGFIDTDMAADVNEPKISPESVVEQTLDALEAGRSEVLTDDGTRQLKNDLPHDQTAIYPPLQRRWDANDSPWTRSHRIG
jgi:NAD(P)-dependent dehydrogenase (short-subunit alcohol dehydrogenase family)